MGLRKTLKYLIAIVQKIAKGCFGILAATQAELNYTSGGIGSQFRRPQFLVAEP